MCGIIGYVGHRPVARVLSEGLERLEYRGYDSAGIAVERGDAIAIRKNAGRIGTVAKAERFDELSGNAGIGHTRWATHGAVTQANAHPHGDCGGRVALVHNGVIENYQALRERLERGGHRFRSQTDTEAVAHALEEELKGRPPAQAFQRTLLQLEGSFALAALVQGSGSLWIGRRNSPLLIGIGTGETLCGSDVPAMLAYTRTFLALEEGEWGELRAEGYRLYDAAGKPVSRKPMHVDWSMEMAQKGGYPHFMLKEIHDQKEFVHESLAADIGKARELLGQNPKVHVVACGTSYHAGLFLKFLLNRLGPGVADAYIASEYGYNANPDSDTLMIAISQSGETADTLQAVRWGRERGAKLLALTNTMGSTLSRLADQTVYLNAGPEVSVAATKTFTSQLAVIYRLAYGKGWEGIPRALSEQLGNDRNEARIKEISARLKEKRSMFFLGRGTSVPLAMEGALKMKEISYIHAEAYPGGELKHGPLSLIEEGVPVVVLAPEDGASARMVGSIKEVKARGAMVVAITNDPKIEKEADETIPIPRGMDPMLHSFAMIVPLQLLAYYTSVGRGIDPDRPRNLAKAITVE